MFLFFVASIDALRSIFLRGTISKKNIRNGLHAKKKRKEWLENRQERTDSQEELHQPVMRKKRSQKKTVRIREKVVSKIPRRMLNSKSNN